MRDRSPTHRDRRVFNDNYENDIQYVLQLCQWFLRPIGMWPLVHNRTSKCEQIFCPILITICYSALCIRNVPCIYYLIFKETNLHLRLKHIGPLVFSMFCGIKYTFIGIKSPALKRCLLHVQRDWMNLKRPEHRVIMMNNVDVGRNLTRLLAILLYSGGVFFYALMPLLSAKRVSENVTVRVLPIPGYEMFFDTQRSPVYELVLSVQWLSAMMSCTVTLAECGLATIFVGHACGQIQLQIMGLKTVIKEKLTKCPHKDPLMLIINSHVSTLRFSKDIEEVLREICLLEIMASTFLICIVEYLCMMDWKNNNGAGVLTHGTLLASIGFNMLIFCYIGELLAEQCAKIGIASYDVEWYDLPGRKALDFVLLIAISNYPPKLTAGKICDLSLTTFGNVLRSSMVYLNFLRTFTEW